MAVNLAGEPVVYISPEGEGLSLNDIFGWMDRKQKRSYDKDEPWLTNHDKDFVSSAKPAKRYLSSVYQESGDFS